MQHSTRPWDYDPLPTAVELQIRARQAIVNPSSSIWSVTLSRVLFVCSSHLAFAAVWLMFAAGAASGQERPNILFITVDDLNTDLGAYGHPLVQSPAIDRLASEGLRFDAAYAQYPVCSPSRSSFLTGLYPPQTGVLSNDVHFREFVPDVTTLPELFLQHGYFTARVGKVFHYNVPEHIGTDGLDDAQSWEERRNPKGVDVDYGPQVNTIYPGTPIGATLSWLSVPGDGSRHTDALVTDAAIDLLQAHHPRDTGQPFFLAVGYFRPHTPFVAPAEYFERYPLADIEPPPDFAADRDDIPTAALADRPGQLEMNEAQKVAAIQGYYASISFVDSQVGRLLNALDEASLRRSTIIVLLSDHGYQLGAHGLWQKGDLFEGSARVPLIVSVPEEIEGGHTRGDNTSSLVELVDLYPTLAELAGLEPPAQIVGRSLVPIIEDPAIAVRRSAYTMAVSMAGRDRPEWQYREVTGQSVRSERYRYTEWGGGLLGVELYDYDADPGELTNVVNEREHLSARARLARELSRRRQQAMADPAQTAVTRSR